MHTKFVMKSCHSSLSSRTCTTNTHLPSSLYHHYIKYHRSRSSESESPSYPLSTFFVLPGFPYTLVLSCLSLFSSPIHFLRRIYLHFVTLGDLWKLFVLAKMKSSWRQADTRCFIPYNVSIQAMDVGGRRRSALVPVFRHLVQCQVTDCVTGLFAPGIIHL